VEGLLTASAVEEWLLAGGTWNPTGLTLATTSFALDLASDDTLRGDRIFLVDQNGVTEYLYDGSTWSFASTVAAGTGFTAGAITHEQDRFWAVREGTIYEYNRLSLTEWAQQGDVFPGDYVDVAARAVNTARTYGLRDTGLDEFQGGQMVRSHNDLFSGATGIAVWTDEDHLFVTTTGGLLMLERDLSDLMFKPAGVTMIDPHPYRDVHTSTEGGNIPGAVVYCRAVTGLPVTGCPKPFADADRDEDVDQADFGLWQACFTGDGNVGIFDSQHCRCFDRTNDKDVDIADFQAFQACMSGPSIVPPVGCETSH